MLCKALVAVLVAICLPALLPAPKLADDLRGQVAVVTGGGGGLGRGIAIGLGEAGATVYVTGRTAASLRATCAAVPPPGACVARVVDSADDDALARFFSELARANATGGRLDILVNNAYGAIGYWSAAGLLGAAFWEAPLALFDEVFTVGVRAHYRATALAVPLMQRAGRGLVVNSNSPGCVWYGVNVPYGAGKCAIDKLTADMALELRTENVDVVSLWPGVLRTDRTRAGAVDGGRRPRRGTPPGLGFLPPFAALHGTALSESPLFAGRVVAHLARDAAGRAANSGKAVCTSQLASAYGVTDEHGLRPPSVFVSVKGVLTMLIPALRDFARLSPAAAASPLQKFYFGTLPDVYIPLVLFKAIGGPPLTMQWPVP